MTTIGIDAGTSTVKAVRFGPDGTAEQTASVPTAVRSPEPGWSEQDLDEVWAGVRRVVREVAPADGRVEAACITAQGDGCWLVDAAGRPARSAVLWNDARASAVVDDWDRRGLLAEAFAVNGSYGNAGLATAQLAWLAAADDPGLAQARTLLSCGSWVYLAMTGQRALHESDAGNPFLDARTGEVAQDLCERLGVGWAVDLLPDLLDGSSAPAPLLPGAADELGLRPGTPVVLGPYDVPATALGLGAVSRGDGFAVLGTTLCVGSAVDGPRLERQPAGMSLRTGYPQRWLLASATLAGTQVLEWARQLLGLQTIADLVQLATEPFAGTGGQEPPLVLPYLSPAGEREPFRDPLAAGAVLGLRLGHGPADVARGVLEGLSLAVRDCLLVSGAEPASLAVCGGGARSAAWCAMLADATGLPVVAAEQDQVGALGAVRAGELATGRVSDLDEVAAEARPGRLHEPDPGRAGRFDQLYERFVQARAHGATRS